MIARQRRLSRAGICGRTVGPRKRDVLFLRGVLKPGGPDIACQCERNAGYRVTSPRQEGTAEGRKGRRRSL
jgi:hypothetical protein